MSMRRGWHYLPLLLTVLISLPAFGQEEMLVSDNFNGSGRIDQNVWRLPSGGDGAFFGQTLVKTNLATDYPTMSNGAVTLELDTFLDDGMGGSAGIFSGAEIQTKRNFALGGGLRFEARARLVDPTPGLIGGMFLFDVQRTNMDGALVRDEIDHELLSNDNTRVFTNYWNDGSFGGDDAAGDPQWLTPPNNYDLTEFNDYRVDWLPNRIEWYVNDQLVRTKTGTSVPDDPMNYRMNIWVPDNTFGQAYNSGLQPATSQATNETYRMEIDDVEITRLNTDRGNNLLGDPSFEDVDFPFFNLSIGDTPDLAATDQWVAFGNTNFSNVVTNSGFSSISMFGPFTGGPDASGIWQNVDASPGDVFEASVFAQSTSGDSIKGQDNYTAIKVEFLNASGDVIPGLDQFLGADSKESIILEGRDPDMPEDVWVQRQVDAVAPAGTTKARLTLLFIQLNSGPGAVFFDDLSLLKLSSNLPSIDGDFNDDGNWDCTDINLLTAAIATESTDLAFDMNGDGSIDINDVTEAGSGWLAVGGANNPGVTGGNAFLIGDADLNGSVEVSDFNIWNGKKFTTSNAWCEADFNADGVVDVPDFNSWNGNKFQSSSVAAVPEPAYFGWLALVAAQGLAIRRRRR